MILPPHKNRVHDTQKHSFVDPSSTRPHGLRRITPKCWFGCTHKAPLLWNLKFVTAETNRYVKVSLAVPTFIRSVAWPAAFLLSQSLAFSPLVSNGGGAARNPINVCPLHLSTRPWRILLVVICFCLFFFFFIYLLLLTFAGIIPVDSWRDAAEEGI